MAQWSVCVSTPGLRSGVSRPAVCTGSPDAVAGLGKNGQIVEIIPSLDLVVVRMGQAPDDTLVPNAFHDDLWDHLNPLLRR